MPAPEPPRPRIIDAPITYAQSASALPTITRRPWDDGVEWTRGKLELFWENRLVPVGHWLGGIPIRLFGGWQRTIRLGKGRRARLGLAWNWEDQGVGMLKQMTRIVLLGAVCVAVLLVLGAAALRIASAVEHITPPALSVATPTNPTVVPAITIHNASDHNGAVAPMPTYTLGLWPGNDTPAKGSQLTLFARLSKQTVPVPNVTITLTIQGKAYSAVTNRDGIATFAVTATGNQPVAVNGTTTVENQTLVASTSFSPV